MLPPRLIMRSTTEILVFALILTSVLALGHYYIWRRLVRDSHLPKRAHQTLTVLLVALLLCQPAIFLLLREVPREQLAPWAYLTFTWMGLLGTLFSLTLIADVWRKMKGLILRRWVLRSKRTPPPSDLDPSRRLVLSRMLAGGVALTGTALSGIAVAQAQGLRLKQVEIRLDRLPRSFDGFKIVQMTDIHVGPTIGKGFVEAIVKMANDQQADLIAITGDLVDGSVKHLGRHVQPLQELKAKYGTLFVTGNHEYYSGADEWVAELARLGIPTLRNDSLRIENEGQSFLVAGVTDFRAASFGDAPNLSRALRERRPEDEVVLLAHQPRAFVEASEHEVGLQLSGHTHGGQFWPWNWVIHLIEPVVAGWAQLKRTQIYVSSGTGYWGPPMRMGTEAEVTLITLRSDA